MEIKKIKATPVAALYTTYKDGVKQFAATKGKGCGCGKKVKKG